MRDDGGHAFPVPSPFIPAPPGHGSLFINADEYGFGPMPGMSLRDWFAGMALSHLADPNSGGNTAASARYAYEIADEMIKARAKP